MGLEPLYERALLTESVILSQNFVKVIRRTGLTRMIRPPWAMDLNLEPQIQQVRS